MSAQLERSEAGSETAALAASSRAPGPVLKRGAIKVLHSRPLLLLVLIVVLSAYMSYWYDISFPTFDNISAVLLNAAVYGILVVGMMLLMIGGAFDLSIGGILALAGVVSGVLIGQHGWGVGAGVVAGLVVGALAGLANGLIVTQVRINALIATLATVGIFRGITQLISGTGIAPISDSFAKIGQSDFLGFQMPFWIMLVVVAVGAWAVSQTRYFRQFYYVGGNRRAATLSGIKSERLMLVAFVIMGTLSGLAGVLNAARLNAAQVSAGTGIELQVITAAVLGGASLRGGEGTVLGGVLGVLFIALLQNALIIMNVDVFWQNIVIGVVLLLAVSLDRWQQKAEA
jgi:ribose transport system permease protein